jgi:hypothetical protein
VRRSYFSFDYFKEEETEMVSRDPKGSQGVYWGAPKVDEREHNAKEVWFIPGYGDENHIFRAHYFCVGSKPTVLERGHA